MMNPDLSERIKLCQSACGPCEKLCDTCRNAPAEYAARVLIEEIAKAIRLLESQGYTIMAKKN
jgi:hypothetical protein